MRIDFPDPELPPISCGDCKLGKLTVYGPTISTSPESVSALRREVRTIPAGRTFLREDETPAATFSLYSGWAFRFKQLSDGRRQILSFVLPGDLLVLEHLCFPHFPLPFSVKSLTSLSACVFSVDDMSQLLQANTEQKDALATTRHDHIASIYERQVDLGRRSARGRIAQLLCDFETRLKRRNLVDGNAFDFPVRQEHLADALGLTTVYVNRTLVGLRKQGVIDFGQQRMTILDGKELARIAQEE